MNLVKIAGIKNWPTPEKVKDVCSFLGFCNFYRAFIKGFSSIARPLNALTQKDQTWTWTKEHQKAFDILKAWVTSEPILTHPKLDKQFKLEVDTSGFAVGAVLLQKKDGGKRPLVGHYSATLNAAEQNYDIYDLELLAIVKALKHWQPFLWDCHTKLKSFRTTWISSTEETLRRLVNMLQGKYLNSLNMTWRFTTSKEPWTVAQTHYQGGQTTTNEKTTTKML